MNNNSKPKEKKQAQSKEKSNNSGPSLKQKKSDSSTNKIKDNNEITSNANNKVKAIENKPHEPKKRLFAITAFNEHNANLKLKEKKEKELKLRSAPVHPSFGAKSTKKTKKEVTSKHIIKLLLDDDVTSINEEIMTTLLKLAKSGLSKQARLCSELIVGIKILIENAYSNDSSKQNFINEIREKIGKVINIIYKLTSVIGGLDNTCSYVKKILTAIPHNFDTIQIKDALIGKLDEFIHTKIYTKDIISDKTGANLIKDNDCILIYGKSKIFRNLLTNAVNNGKTFKVIYADNRQDNHIKTEVEFLSKLGVNVIYSYVNGISGIIEKVTKVFIKAKSMLSNGNLLGAVGTSMISCIAYNFKKPVIAFSQTYKFWDKIMMNSFQSENIKVETTPYALEKSEFCYNTMRLIFDITPANFINMVVCELGYIPPTSVPVVIREFGQEDIEFEV